jgi:radical SAM superfamily enzyme YgiQ (UPF0313 family)
VKKSLLMITPENEEIRRYRRRQFNNFTQLTMPYLAGFVDEDRFRIRLVDEYNEPIPYDEPADLVAITVNTPNAAHVYAMADRFRARGARVALGGPHATLLPEEASAHCDHLFVGETEETWPLFLEAFLEGAGEARYVSPRPPSLAGLPIPRRDLIRQRPFTRGAVFATRGCPYHCDYCNLRQIYAPGFRTRPVEEVVADIRSMPNRHFVFWDDHFFADRAYAVRLMSALKGLGKRWAAQTTIDRCADEELLRLAREAGCVYLFVGLETFTDAGVQAVGKGCNRVPEYRAAIEAMHRHGISIQAGVIFGLDSDTKEVFRETLEACEALGIDGVTASILTPLPGTPIHQAMKRDGRLLSEDWTWYNGKTRVAFTPRGMTAEELLAGFQWFRSRFHAFPSIFRRMAASRANPAYTLLLNLGYRWSLPGRPKP